jgi:hypothetical protein
MEKIYYSKMLVSTFQSALCHNPEERDHHHYHRKREKIKFILLVDQQVIVWMNLLHETAFL